MIYSVFGQRDVYRRLYEDYENVDRCMTSLGPIEALILGGGKGLDALVKTWAERNNIPFEVKPPSIIDDAKRAFDARNNWMIDQSDVGVVFWDGVFPHTVKLVSKIVIARKTLIVFPL